jgi:O-antigen ligase
MDYFKFAKWLLYLPVLLMTVIVTRTTLFPFIVGKYVFFRTTIGLAAILFLLGVLFQNARGAYYLSRLKALFKKPLVIAVTAFVAIFLLAGFFGVDPGASFWSNFERGEGGLQMLFFFSYFILILTLLETEKDWRGLLWCAIVGGVLMGVYGFLAALNADGFIGSRFSEDSYRFQGSIGNPAYVAVYALFLIFYCLYFLLREKARKFSGRMWGLIALILFFSAIFLLTGTRGAFLGLGTAVIMILGYVGFSYKRFRMKMLALIILFLAVAGSLVAFQDSAFVKKIPGSRIFAISLTTETFEDRTIMWKTAWDGFLERPILGWGPENFIHVFDRHFNTKYYDPAAGFGSWFDRAHSVIFDYLVETGILGFLAYLSIFVAFYVTFIRRKKATVAEDGSFQAVFERALFFAIPLAYLVQGLVLFDVSITYLNLFTMLALSLHAFSPVALAHATPHAPKKK